MASSQDEHECEECEEREERNVYIYAKTPCNSWKDLDDGEITEKGRVKKDWKCHLCDYCSCDFKIVDVKKDKFKLVCKDCARMEDMIVFCFDEETHEKIMRHLRS